jgi:hypothetical protein
VKSSEGDSPPRLQALDQKVRATPLSLQLHAGSLGPCRLEWIGPNPKRAKGATNNRMKFLP